MYFCFLIIYRTFRMMNMLKIEQLQEKVQRIFENISFVKSPVELYQPIEYTMSQGGKRLRPLLAFIGCNMFDGNVDDVENPAIGLEIFHNFTLLHDDIMDQAPIRRGKPSVYTKWNTNTAILSGDTMFVVAYEYVVKTPEKVLVPILKIFNQTAREVCEGQQLDMNYETQKDISIPDYIEMIRLKTAVLIAASLEIGAVSGGATPGQASNLYQFGINFGLAFQLRDDLLDAFGNVEVFGKQTGNDILTNKKTYLFLKAFEKANAKQYAELEFAFASLEGQKKIDTVLNIFTELGIKEDTEAEIESYYNRAIHHLNQLGLPQEKTSVLFDFAAKLKSRQV